MKTSRRFISAITLLLLTVLLFNLASCSIDVKAQDLTKDVSANTVTEKKADDKFIANTASFSVDLFKKSITKDKNSLISPLSVMLALSMTANGADKETLTQMQTVLGKDITIDELNEYLYTYVKNLPSSEKAKLSIADSIWFKDSKDFTVEKDFLQKNADYYKAAVYKSAFDKQTSKDINDWVNKNTNGMINEIIGDIDSNVVMYLINAVCFEAEWSHIYNNNNINEGDFTAFDGSKQKVKFMYSEEDSYIYDGKATGFIKPYANGYSFVALLPNDGVSVDDYISSMTGEGFINLLKNKKSATVNAFLPKFSYAYDIEMIKALEALGMTDAFEDGKADLSKLGKSNNGNLFISKVIHKTFISVDEKGTKAGAATAVEVENDCAPAYPKTVRLDRPFVYAIIDNSTNLPVFIGTVMSIN